MDIFMRNIAFSAKEIDIRIILAEKLHRPPFPTDPPVNFYIHLFKKKGCGILTLPTREVGETFLSTYGRTSIMVNGRNIEFRLSDKPVNEGRVRYIRSTPWEDPKILEMRNRQKAKDSQPIKLQGFGFGHFCRDGSFLVDSNTLGSGNIACDLDLRQITLQLEQDPSDMSTAFEMSALTDLLNRVFSESTTFTSSKTASYTPSQIKRVTATDSSQTKHLVIIDSDTPPIFKLLNISSNHGSEEIQSHRLSSLRDDLQMPPSCLVLPRCSKFAKMECVSHVKAMANVDRQLLAMKFGLAFEVEKAVLNGDLEPSEILSLSRTIHSLSSTPSGLPPAAFRFFVATLNDPSRRRYIHSRSLDQHLINATKHYSVKSSSKITPYLLSPATFECYHLIVTPTSRYLEGPIPDQSNSVLRRFGNHECFLRVSIQDERRSKLRREPGMDMSRLLRSRFRVLLTDGLHLTGRRYEFLGYSMSGLKEHSVWFVTPFESDTGRIMNAAKIRKKLGKVICLRPSQIKFDGLDNFTFDVQSTSSRPRPMFLNRPLIMLLEHLGVRWDVVTDLQSTSIREVQSIQTSLTQATKVFLQHSLGGSYHLPSLFNNIFKYLDLDISDLPDSLHHQLMEEALYCAATHALREIKYRAHILVPGSVTLLGVSDEYDCLAEGEIFATVYDESKATEQFIEGRVLITRSPQVHPGDVQLVTAVRRPELNHLKNVVVFSCRGARSLQSCLGGGDIDGDEYNIITDTNLHPPRTATPGAYKPLERKRITRPCTIKDVADFVINYIETDLLGYISILHLRIADLKGPDCQECMQLAEAASHAVDFPKTGTPVNFTSLPRPPSDERPDFLAPESVDSVDNNLYYPSEKLLGILFRRVPTATPPELRNDASNTPSDGNCIYHALMEIDMEEMVQLLEAYSEYLTSIAQTFTISKSRVARISEAALISGTITGKWPDHRKRREAVIAMNLQTHELCTSIRRELRRVSLQDSDSNDNFQIYDDEEGEMDDDELVFETRAEIFTRAWAAWKVAEDTLTEDPSAFGPQSFGLIALGLLLDVIKDATTDAYYY